MVNIKLLYINACVRQESRTNKIAKALIAKMAAADCVEEIRLDSTPLLPLNETRLEERMALSEKGEWSAPAFHYARQFADADAIVISAPYWDGSFPAILKLYLENIYIVGIVSRYGEDGRPCGMCKAKKLYYVTTAGGPYNESFGYGYWQDLAVNYFGIPETQLIQAEMLDVEGFDAAEIVERTIASL